MRVDAVGVFQRPAAQAGPAKSTAHFDFVAPGQQRGFANLTELIIALHTELIEPQPALLGAGGEPIPLKVNRRFGN